MQVGLRLLYKISLREFCRLRAQFTFVCNSELAGVIPHFGRGNFSASI